MPRPRVYVDSVHDRLLDEAAAMVAESGADAVTMRALAERAGTKTTAIYRLFGSRHGLFARLHEAALADFVAGQQAVATGDNALADAIALAAAYRAWAHANPHRYAVMFGGGTVLPQSYAEAWAGQDPFRDVVARLLEPIAAPRRPDVTTVVASFWTAVHGFVSLELKDLLPAGTDRDAAYLGICVGVLGFWAERD